MIEKYFRLGITVEWATPGANSGLSKDGSVIFSPVVNHSPMVYQGLDGELYELFSQHVKYMGLSKGMNIPYNWLVYAHGHTTNRLLASGDVLTGPMSGCLITLCSTTGGRYVGHVGTVEANYQQNRKVKLTFANCLPSKATGFNPADAWDFNEIQSLMNRFNKPKPKPSIFALVTTSGEFFSILMFDLKDRKKDLWCVGGIKKVTPMNRDQLYFALKTL
jgi:hypothetical protein